MGLKELFKGIAPQDVERHRWLVDSGGRGGVYRVTRGTAEAWDGTVRVQRYRRGSLIGLEGAAGQGALPVRVVSEDFRARRLSRRDFMTGVKQRGFHLELQQALAREQRARGAALSRHLKDLTRQSFPGGRAVYEPVPYTAGKVRVWAFLVRPRLRTPGKADALKCLPPGVGCDPGLPWVLLATQYEDFSSSSGLGEIRYGEVSLLAPSIVKGRPVMASAWLFPDNLMALYAGREIYGFPKMYGHTVLDRHSGNSRHGRIVLRTQWGTALDLPYRAWSLPRLGEDSEMGQAWRQLHEEVPELAQAQKDCKSLLPEIELPTHLRDPRRAFPMLFESVSYGMADRSALVESLTDWLYLDLAGWKRLYESDTKATQGPDWKAEQFVADRVVASRLSPLSIDVGSLALIRADDTELFPPEGRQKRPVLRVLPELLPGRFGLYYELSARMEAGQGSLLDLRALYGGGRSPKPSILDWGPGIWRRFGWLDD